MTRIYAFIDKNFGLSFAGKRPTYDYRLMTDMVAECPHLAGSDYSIQKLRNVVLSENKPELLDGLKIGYLKYRKNIFVELETEEELKEYIKRAKEIILYMWDSEYPSTVKFPRIDNDPNWECVETSKVEGKSHSNVTKFKYKRRA